MTGLRDRLRDRALPTQTVPLPADRQAYAEAHAELEEATAAVQRALRGNGSPPPDVVEREQAARAAVAALDIDYWTVRTLPVDEWEALKSAHPAKPDATHGWDFEPETFHPALLAETVTLDGDSDDEKFWANPGGAVGPAERQHLINTAIGLNASVSVVSEAVGKGSRQTSS